MVYNKGMCMAQKKIAVVDKNAFAADKEKLSKLVFDKAEYALEILGYMRYDAAFTTKEKEVIEKIENRIKAELIDRYCTQLESIE
jgi:hypothetical protein